MELLVTQLAQETTGDFPIFIHSFTIPLTLGFGFLFGWIVRGAIAKRFTKRPPGAR